MIKDLKNNDFVYENYMIKSIQVKITKTSKHYLDFIFSDKTGTLVGKLWDYTPDKDPLYSAGDIVSVNGIVQEYNGNLQLKVNTIEKIENPTEEEIKNFIQASPLSTEKMLSEILEYVEKIEIKDIKKITKALIEENKEDLLIYPAAKSFHHAMKGGLLYHTYTMLRVGSSLLKIYPFLNADLVYAGVIIHDIGKLKELKCNSMSMVEDYTTEGKLLGHIIQGICEIDKVGKKANIDEEVVTILKHLVLSHHYHEEYGSPKKPMLPEAEILHYLDVIDARMYQMNHAIENVEPGSFSQREPALEYRSIYKPKFIETEEK